MTLLPPDELAALKDELHSDAATLRGIEEAASMVRNRMYQNGQRVQGHYTTLGRPDPVSHRTPSKYATLFSYYRALILITFYSFASKTRADVRMGMHESRLARATRGREFSIQVDGVEWATYKRGTSRQYLARNRLRLVVVFAFFVLLTLGLEQVLVHGWGSFVTRIPGVGGTPDDGG